MLRTRRRAAVVVLAVVVSLAHWALTEWLPLPRLGDGAAERMPQRIEVAFVRELAPAAPPPAPVVVRRAPRARPKAAAALPPAEAASAPAADEIDAATVAAAIAQLPQLPVAASAPVEAPPAPEVAAASPAASAASAAVAFEWPPSTRLSYRLSGNYRGEVVGGAQVEWVRVGTRYQVHIDIGVGPLISRRMSSEGELVGERLLPSRYDEETRVLFREPRRVTILLGPQEIVLANGDRLPRADGVQDSASQFIQLAALFATRPALLQPGGTIEILLALRNRVGAWTYDVLGQEEIRTPIGLLDTVHLRPRRVMSGGTELTAEVWFAPQLRFLPVRMRVRQDEATYLDLVLAQKPEIAAQ